MHAKAYAVLGLAGVLVFIAVISVVRKDRAAPPEPIARSETTSQVPVNIDDVEIDWHANTAYFPDPVSSDGDYWRLSYSEEPLTWSENKRVSARSDGRLYATFTKESLFVCVWVSGGQRPTYGRTFDRP